MRERILLSPPMLLPSRSFLPLLLAVLQFFAPLLHAHTAQRTPHFGLHIPGLEAYNAPAGGVSASRSETGCTAAADCIVAVDDGFRDKPSPSAKAPSDGAALPLLTWIFSPDAAPALRAELTQPPLPSPRHHSPSLSPRAPPAV
jgi:hypothetical protein